MTYKKYITKNGKTYGPYVYHSKRINGKVVSEYHGAKSNLPKRKMLIPVLAVAILLVAGGVFLFFSNQRTSGHIIVNLDGELIGGELNNGKINFVLFEGELIPADSQIIIENNGLSYTYSLGDLVESEEVLSGDFYVEGSVISGSGEGYGLEGTKTIYPTVNFELELVEEGGNETQTPPEEEEPEEQNETESQANKTINISENETVNLPEDETPTMTENETINLPENETSPVDEGEDVGEKAGTGIEKKKEKIPEKNLNKSRAPITGDLVSGIFGSVSSFLSGFATSEGSVSGSVSRGNDFVYSTNLNWRVVPGSVTSNGEVISESEITLEEVETTIITGIIVRTNYSVDENGFGKDYLGRRTKTFSVDLERINLTLVEGPLTVSLVHGDQIAVYEISYEDLGKINTTEFETFSLPEFLSVSLTDSERATLLFMLNQSEVEVSALTYRDKYLVNFKIGTYSAEYSYPRSLDDEKIALYLERDKTLWLKDIAKKLSEKPPLIGIAENFNSSYSF